MRRRGFSEEAIAAALLVENEARCEPPLDEEEVRGIAASVARYAPAEAVRLQKVGSLPRRNRHGHTTLKCKVEVW
jgi:hypothetical protein